MVFFIYFIFHFSLQHSLCEWRQKKITIKNQKKKKTTNKNIIVKGTWINDEGARTI